MTTATKEFTVWLAVVLLMLGATLWILAFGYPGSTSSGSFANEIGAEYCAVYQSVEVPESTELVSYYVKDYADGYTHVVYTTRYHAAHVDTICIERRK